MQTIRVPSLLSGLRNHCRYCCWLSCSLGQLPGRNALAWIYLQSTEAITNATHIHAFPLDRFDPTCPQCM